MNTALNDVASEPPCCCICLAPDAQWQLTAEDHVCSRECEAAYCAQWCASCGCHEADGEPHSMECEAAYRADLAAE